MGVLEGRGSEGKEEREREKHENGREGGRACT